MKSREGSPRQGQGGRARKELVQAQRGRGGLSLELEELSRPRAGLALAGETSGVRAWAPRGCTLPEGGLRGAERARLGVFPSRRSRGGETHNGLKQPIFFCLGKL